MLVLILMSMATFSSLILWVFVGLLAMLALGAAYLAGSLIASLYRGLAISFMSCSAVVGIWNVPQR